MINKDYDKKNEREGLTNEEIVAMRIFAHKLPGMRRRVIENAAREFKVTPETATKVLEGEIEPYAGGPLIQLQLQGCNPNFLESTRNKQRFVRGVIFLAKIQLSPEEFTIFCNNNGMLVSEAEKYLLAVHSLEERYDMSRIQAIIKRHAEGEILESAVSAQSQRPRKSTGV